MPGDPLLDQIARIALRLDSAAGFALAGGGAMIAHGMVSRPTQDIDLFAIDVALIRGLADDITSELVARDMSVERVRTTDTFVRLVATTADGRSVGIDLAQDARIRTTVTLGLGAVIHRDELAADKTLALFSRAAARDLVDVCALAAHFSGADLLQLAAEKDHGFDRAVLGRALVVAAERPDRHFQDLGVAGESLAELRGWALGWADALLE